MRTLKSLSFVCLMILFIWYVFEGSKKKRIVKDDTALTFDKLHQALKGEENLRILNNFYYADRKAREDRGFSKFYQTDLYDYATSLVNEYQLPYSTIFLGSLEHSNEWYGLKGKTGSNRTDTILIAGPLQIMATTGRDHDLIINEYVDERYDPKKAIEFSVKYIYWLHKRVNAYEELYGFSTSEEDKWFFAYAAWYAGPGNMKKWYKDSHGQFENFDARIEGKKYKRSQEFVPKLMAHCLYVREIYPGAFKSSL